MKKIKMFGQTIMYIEVLAKPGYKPELSGRFSRDTINNMAEVDALRYALFFRNTGPDVDNRLVQFTPEGVRVFEFRGLNYGLRSYDAEDYMIAAITDVRLRDD